MYFIHITVLAQYLMKIARHHYLTCFIKFAIKDVNYIGKQSSIAVESMFHITS